MSSQNRLFRHLPVVTDFAPALSSASRFVSEEWDTLAALETITGERSRRRSVREEPIGDYEFPSGFTPGFDALFRF